MMMTYGYGGGWMWGLGALMTLAVLIIIGLGFWTVIANRSRDSATGPGSPASGDIGGRRGCLRTRRPM